jgi:hypothetical protein
MRQRALARERRNNSSNNNNNNNNRLPALYYYQHGASGVDPLSHEESDTSSASGTGYQKNATTPHQLSSLEIDSFHTRHRTPLHVPDKNYKVYKLGVRYRKQPPSVLSKACLLQTCFWFSVVAVLFLGWVSLLLARQPLFVPKCLPRLQLQQQSSSSNNTTNTFNKASFLINQIPPASFVAWHTMIAYGVVALLCWGAWNQQLLRSTFYNYEELPDHGINTSTTTNNNVLCCCARRVVCHVRLAISKLKQWMTARGWRRRQRKQTPKTV